MGCPLMRYLVDTNVWISAMAGKQPAMLAIQQLASVEWAGFSAITRLEIFGFPGLTVQAEKAFQEVLREFNEVEVSSAVIDRAIQVRKPTKVKTPDALIAATAFTQQAILLTANERDFAHIPGLQILNPDNLPTLS
jgi:predicted nucleic acid-binding protein